jgi:CRISPR/Cas system-associated endoribonuclease Cas2
MEKDYSILKINDFPARNRGDKIDQNVFKGYLNKNKGEKLERRFSDLLDPATAVVMAQCVAEGKPVSNDIV